MGSFMKRRSLAPQGLRYKLMVAFVLMSLIPLLACIYIISNIMNVFEDPSLLSISVILLVTIGIAWLGLLLAKNIVEPVIDMSIEARIIASGNFDRKISTVGREDEIGELGSSINLLVKRIKDNINELKDYGERTREINLEIQKKMVTLYDILQVSDLISAAVDLERILDVVLDKLSHFYGEGFAVVYLTKDKITEFTMSGQSNAHNEELINIHIKLGEGLLGKIARKRRNVVIDGSTPRSSSEYAFKNEYKLQNAVVMPIFTGSQTRGLIICGNYMKEFTYTNEDIDLISVFAKHLSIAVENDILLTKTKILSVKDDLTGLYNWNYMVSRLDEEIGRAVTYQRPCSLILVDIDNFKNYSIARGQLAAESILKKVADLLKQGLVEPIDKVGRIGDDEFAVILPEKNKKRAIGIAEEIRKAIEKLSPSELPTDKITASMGVSENPLDGSSADQLWDKARSAVKQAKAGEKNRVIS